MKTEIIRVDLGHVNCYLLVNGDNAVLVDTGMAEEDRLKILKVCEPYNIRLIALTHGHVDHMFNAKYLSNALGVPVAINERDVELIENEDFQPMHADTASGLALLAMTKANSSFVPKFAPTVFLKEGDSLEDYGIPAKVVELPGHTKGSIGLDIEGTDLIVGDALFNNTNPTLSLIYTDKDSMLKSAKRISDMGERVIHFGHGPSAANGEYA